MATQYLAIAKLAGKAGESAFALFEAWGKFRTSDDPNEWGSDQWPERICKQADAWADELRLHAHVPPVVFFAEYVDMWSFCPPARFLREFDLMQMMGVRYELYCLKLPFPEALTKQLALLNESGQFDEDRLFANMTLIAAAAWEKVVDSSVLVFLRRTVGGFVQDEEIERSEVTIPDWIETFRLQATRDAWPRLAQARTPE